MTLILVFLSVIMVDFAVAAMIEADPRIFFICSFILSVFSFALRGFDNTKKVTFNVNEQITLGGDSSYYITKEEYIGKSRKPEYIIYYDSKYCMKYDETSELRYAYYYQDYQTAMNYCQKLKSAYDMEELENMQKKELKKLSTVHTTNKYTI